MGRININDLPDEMRYHLRGITQHTIDLLSILLPEEDKQTIATLTTSVVREVLTRLDSGYKWNITIKPKDET